MLRTHAGAALCAALLCVLTPARAAVPASAPIVATPAPAPVDGAVLLPANAVVELEMLDGVSSATNKRGDFFRMRVAQPVRSGARELVPAGTIAIGQVVHAQKAGAGGRGGELILAARYLELPQGQVKLHSTLGAAGANRVGSSLALSVVAGPLALFVKGKTVSMPVGAPLSARLAADTLVSPSPMQGDSAASTP
jgi:hypothetical protein